MYESYDYNAGQAEEPKQPTIEEIKAREKAIKAEKKAHKKAQRAAKRAARKEKGTGKSIMKTVLLAALFGVVASVTFSFSNKIGNKYFGKGNNTSDKIASADITSNAAEEKATDEEKNSPVIKETVPDKKEISDVAPGNQLMYGDVVKVVEETMPSIVAITNKSIQEVRSWYGMGVQQYESESAGSGIIIGQNDTELLVATNAHVVEGAQTLTVCFIDDSINSATIKGTDESNDLAVIAVDLNEVDGKTLEAIKVATIGDSQNLKIGEQVVAIGNALGYGQSVTTGIVSALDRDITDDNVDNSYIQTDAAINPGNSGGALLNMKGELVGINSAKLASSKIEGMGYAIPISAAMPIMDSLMARVSRSKVDGKDAGYVGISGFSVTEDVSRQYGIPEGIYVSEVSDGAAADRAGIQKGDIITAFDGLKIDSIAKLRERLDYYSAGEEVDITIFRTDNGMYKEMTFKIVLDGREGTPLDSSSQSDDEDSDSAENEDNGDEEDGREYNFRDFYSPDGGYNSIFDIFGY